MAKRRSRKKYAAPIAYQDNTTATENLPLPYVYYPGHYGTFFCFAENETSELYLCSCTKEAIENYIQIKLKDESFNSHALRTALITDRIFPQRLAGEMEKKITRNNYDKAIEILGFKGNLCHECNRSIPSYEYCHPMYGGQFTRNYGWYINKQYYEFGIDSMQTVFLDSCPEEILEMVEIKPILYQKSIIQAYESNKLDDKRNLEKEFGKQKRRINKFVENVVREKFGHKKVGESWVNETNIYYIVKKLFPDKEVRRHYRPDFLNGLEFDVYIPHLKIGIEYQGIQHFEPIKPWGGEDALKKVKERDALKCKLAKDNGINLIYVNYDEPVSEELIERKIQESTSDVG